MTNTNLSETRYRESQPTAKYFVSFPQCDWSADYQGMEALETALFFSSSTTRSKPGRLTSVEELSGREPLASRVELSMLLLNVCPKFFLLLFPSLHHNLTTAASLLSPSNRQRIRLRTPLAAPVLLPVFRGCPQPLVPLLLARAVPSPRRVFDANSV
jgi:hypothetical protein